MEIFLSIIVRVCVYEAYERSMCYTLAIDMQLQNLYLISSLRYIYIKKNTPSICWIESRFWVSWGQDEIYMDFIIIFSGK